MDHCHGQLAALTLDYHFRACADASQHRREVAGGFLFLDVDHIVSHSLSKYPPAEPEALRLLAPQRGLIATAEKQKQLQRHEAREATGFGKTKATAGGILPE